MAIHITRTLASAAAPAAASALEQFHRAVEAASDEGRQLALISLDVKADDADVACLSGPERERAARFHRAVDRDRYLRARSQLRRFLAQRLGVAPEQVSLGCNRYGKPELTGHQAASGWRFNLSYSAVDGAGLALFAFTRLGRIGVDVEAVRLLDDADRLALRFFSPQEYEVYRQLPVAERPLAFINGWTRKEAFVKALGTGLSFALADFDVSLAPGLPARLLRVGRMSGERSGWRLHSIGPAGGRVAAVVTRVGH